MFHKHTLIFFRLHLLLSLVYCLVHLFTFIEVNLPNFTGRRVPGSCTGDAGFPTASRGGTQVQISAGRRNGDHTTDRET